MCIAINKLVSIVIIFQIIHINTEVYMNKISYFVYLKSLGVVTIRLDHHNAATFTRSNTIRNCLCCYCRSARFVSEDVCIEKQGSPWALGTTHCE